MNKIEKIKSQIEKLESIINEIKNELNNISTVSDNTPKKEIQIPEEDLHRDYELLFNKFLSGDVDFIRAFIKNKDKNYLKVFCKSNNLPVDISKASKDDIFNTVIQWFVQRKVILKKVT